MVRVIFIDQQGEHTVTAEEGQTLMQVARDHLSGVLVGECGGSCICASCHAYIDPRWLRKLPRVTDNEAHMLDAIDTSRYNSRLTCRLPLTEELDGIVVRVPASRY